MDDDRASNEPIDPSYPAEGETPSIDDAPTGAGSPGGGDPVGDDAPTGGDQTTEDQLEADNPVEEDTLKALDPGDAPA